MKNQLPRSMARHHFATLVPSSSPPLITVHQLHPPALPNKISLFPRCWLVGRSLLASVDATIGQEAGWREKAHRAPLAPAGSSRLASSAVAALWLEAGPTAIRLACTGFADICSYGPAELAIVLQQARLDSKAAAASLVAWNAYAPCDVGALRPRVAHHCPRRAFMPYAAHQCPKRAHAHKWRAHFAPCTAPPNARCCHSQRIIAQNTHARTHNRYMS